MGQKGCFFTILVWRFLVKSYLSFCTYDYELFQKKMIFLIFFLVVMSNCSIDTFSYVVVPNK